MTAWLGLVPAIHVFDGEAGRRAQNIRRKPGTVIGKAEMPGLMEGKRGLIMGVANDHSIAWGIAKTLAQHGAKLAFHLSG